MKIKSFFKKLVLINVSPMLHTIFFHKNPLFDPLVDKIYFEKLKILSLIICQPFKTIFLF